VDTNTEEYRSWVAERNEKRDAARDLEKKIDDGKAAPEERKAFRGYVKDVKALNAKSDAYRDSQSLDEFKKMESAGKKSRGSSVADKGGAFTSIGRVKTEYEAVDEETMRRYSSVKRELGDAKFDAISDPEFSGIFTKALRFGSSELSRLERKALDAGDDGRGGITAPVDMLNFIVGRMNSPTRVSGLVREINTSRDSIEFMRNPYDDDDDYTNSFRRKKTGSKPKSSTEGNVMTSSDSYLVPAKIAVHTFMMVGQINNDLLEDSTFDLEGWLKTELSKSAAQDMENDIVNGDGVGCPMGVMQYVDTGEDFSITSIPSGSASTVTYAGLQELLWSLPEQYIENAILLMKRTAAGKELGKLVSAGGQRIFGDPGAPNGSSLVGPSGQTLEGYPVIWSSKMPSVSSGTYPILFWDPSAYIKLTRSNISFKILDQTRATENMTEIVAKIRYGGDLLEPYKARAQDIASS